MPEEPLKTGREDGSRRLSLLLFALVAAALLLRLVSALNDFWLDEIWSLQVVERFHSALQVLTDYRHDNNHPLNSWVLYLLRGREGWLVYRLPACLAGTAAVAAAAWLGARRDRLTALTCAFVFALDYFLIHYASEARGYGYVQLFTLATLALALAFLERPRASIAALFFLCACLGFFSHLTFFYALAGFLAWVPVELWRRRGALRIAFAQSCALLLPTSIFALLYAWLFVRGMQTGGAEPSGKGEVLLKTLGWVLLGGSAKPLLWGAAAIFALLCVRAAIEQRRAGRLEWILFSVAMVAAPLALLLSSRENFFAPRYFSVPAVFLLLVLAECLAALLARPGRARILGAAACALFVAVNAIPLRTLWQVGRGSYLDALEWICAADSNAQVTIGSDHDFRYPLVLGFYARNAPSCAGRIAYEPHGSEPLPRWILRSAFRPDLRPAPEGKMPYGAKLPDGEVLALRAFYPSSELSGWGVIVYERVRK